jgi:hypothetical protein
MTNERTFLIVGPEADRETVGVHAEASYAEHGIDLRLGRTSRP